MSTTTGKLKYLWTAMFDDGSTIEQPSDDRYSKHDDKAEANPSAFRDVVEKEETSKLLAFYLTNQENGDIVGVDLVDGYFAINGVPFEAHNQFVDLRNKELKIVFHREVRLDTTMSAEDWEQQEQTHYVNRYFIGWQVVGENLTQTIAVN